MVVDGRIMKPVREVVAFLIHPIDHATPQPPLIKSEGVGKSLWPTPLTRLSTAERDNYAEMPSSDRFEGSLVGGFDLTSRINSCNQVSCAAPSASSRAEEAH